MLGLPILLQIFLKITLLRKKLEKKGGEKPDILHHLLLPINCHFLLEKAKLKPVLVSWPILRHPLLSVKNVTARQSFSLKDRKRLGLMKYIFVFFVPEEDCISAFYL